jgi:hypothetical protein
MMITLLAGQLLAAAEPVMAAELTGDGDQRMGAFGGLRVRLPLGGQASERQLRAGLTLAPVLHDRLAGGEPRLRIGEGLELGLRGRAPMRLSIAGQDVRRLAARESGDDGGIPTGALIAGGLVLVALGSVIFVAVALENADDSD